MQCLVCQPYSIGTIDAKGKHKGLMNYNMNHGTSFCKNMIVMNIQICMRNGDFLVAKGYRNPK
jgi:hypothetical protein